MSSSFPSLSAVLKGRDVEDPVSLWINRPIAYAIAGAVFRTPVTPNQITFAALAVGAAAGAAWGFGATPAWLVVGGILLWISAMLDCADGILARAKRMQSQFGRALDGSADMIVAGATLAGAVYHLWVQQHDPAQMILFVLALLTTLSHLYLFDFYKESYMRATRVGAGGGPIEGEDLAALEAKQKALRDNTSVPWWTRTAFGFLVGFVRNQSLLVRLTNPAAQRDGAGGVVTSATADIYRRFNRWPMRLWGVISLGPHNFLLAICGMFGSFDTYLFIRLFGMNAVFLVVLVWQRWATRRTLDTLAVHVEETQPVAGT